MYDSNYTLGLGYLLPLFYDEPSSLGFILIMGAISFALSLCLCFLCLLSILLSSCKRPTSKKKTFLVISPVASKHLIQKYNSVKLNDRKGLDGPCPRDQPDGDDDGLQRNGNGNGNGNGKVDGNNNNNNANGYRSPETPQSVHLQPLERLKMETPICRLLDQTPRRPNAPPPVPKRISSLYRASQAGVNSPRSTFNSPRSTFNSPRSCANGGSARKHQQQTILFEMATTHL